MGLNPEIMHQAKEDLRWVVVSSGEKNSLSFDNISNATIDMLADKNNDRAPLAYDVMPDLFRYQELKNIYGERSAELYLKDEMRSDMISHFSELGSESSRVKLYEYEYTLGLDGQLRESEGEKDLVHNMFLGQENEVTSSLWMSHIIPFLEDSQVGQSAFTLSVKADSIFEGAYDFSYFMIKTNENTIKCMGVEVDLSREEQREIINNQLVNQGAPEDILLKKDFYWKEARGRAIFYEKGKHTSLKEMFVSVVGSQVSKIRSGYELGGLENLEEFFSLERQKTIEVEDEARKVVDKMVRKIVSGDSHAGVRNDLRLAQINHLMQNDPELLWEARESGYVMLACGMVNIGEEGSFQIDSGSEKSWNYHKGDCVSCKNSNVEVGPCSICKKCEKMFDEGKL